jgi:hypothetical protein
MKKLAAIALAFIAFTYSHVALSSTSPGAGWVAGLSTTGQTVWFGPASQSKSSAAMGQAIWTAATAGGGANVSTSVKLAVGAGDAVVVSKGLATGSAVFSTFKAIAGGPVGLGLTALMLAPAVIDWLAKGNAKIDPSGAVSKKSFGYPRSTFPSDTLANCDAWEGVSGTVAGVACSATGGKNADDATGGTGSVCLYKPDRADAPWACVVNQPPPPTPWVPATIEDIRLQMETLPVQVGVINAILDAGGSIPIAYAPGGLTGPATTSSPSVVKTTPIPKPADISSSSTVAGNPFGISPNTPVVTSSGTSARDLVVDGKSISIPTKSTTTSTFNPTTNQTISTTVNSADPHTVSATTTPKSTTTYSTGPDPVTGATVPKSTSTTTTSTVTTVTNNVTNTVITNTTNTVTNPASPDSVDPKPEEDLGTISDTAFGDIPKLYERKYPDGIKGVWDDKITAIKAAPLFTLVGSLMPTNIGSSGSCPSFMIPVNFGQWGEYGNLDFSPPCMVWDFGKVIIIISSLLLARRLIFGG